MLDGRALCCGVLVPRGQDMASVSPLLLILTLPESEESAFPCNMRLSALLRQTLRCRSQGPGLGQALRLLHQGTFFRAAEGRVWKGATRGVPGAEASCHQMVWAQPTPYHREVGPSDTVPCFFTSLLFGTGAQGLAEQVTISAFRDWF